MPRVGLTRRYRPNDVIFWRIPAGTGNWHTEGISKIRHKHDGVYTCHDGVIVTTDEIVELIATSDHPRPHRMLAA